MFPAFFLEAAASVSPEQPPESGVGSSPKDAGEAAQERPTILIDCVTLWVSNILFALPEPEDLTAFETAVRTEVNALLALMERSNCRWILVSGETGLGGIEPTRLGRNYCDGLGLANQLIAAQAREAFLVGLEDELHRALEFALMRLEQPCSAQQHRGMHIVSAGVHLSRTFRRIR